MRTQEKLAVGAIAAAGAMWGMRAWLRCASAGIELRDRVVVITGSDSGFGLIQARQVAEQGAIVVLAARNGEALEAAADAVALAAQAIWPPFPPMFPSRRRPSACLNPTVARFGRIDVVINTAGLMLVGPEPTMTIDDFRYLMDVNFGGRG